MIKLTITTDGTREGTEAINEETGERLGASVRVGANGGLLIAAVVPGQERPRLCLVEAGDGEK